MTASMLPSAIPNRYPFRRPKRGYALLVCNENFKTTQLSARTSQQADLKSLKEMLEQQFQFEVDLKIDQTTRDMHESIKQGKSVSSQYL